MLPMGDSLQKERHTQLKVKKWTKRFHDDGKGKKTGRDIFISDKIDLYNKDCNKSQRRVLYNDKGINIVRRHIIYKYRCTHQSRTKIEKENINTYELQGSSLLIYQNSLPKQGHISKQVSSVLTPEHFSDSKNPTDSFQPRTNATVLSLENFL